MHKFRLQVKACDQTESFYLVKHRNLNQKRTQTRPKAVEQSVLLTWLEGKYEISDHFVESLILRSLLV